MKKGKKLLRELARKLIHLSGLLIILLYTILNRHFSHQIAILGLTALLLILLEIEYFRIEHRLQITKVFSGLFRKHERNQLSGAVYMVISCIIVFSAFDYWIAGLAVFMAVLGDFFAALVGFFGKRKLLRNKTVLGTLAGFIANVSIGYLLLPDFPSVYLSMAITASIVELVTNKLDDNLTVPVTAGFIGQVVAYAMAINLPEVATKFLII